MQQGMYSRGLGPAGRGEQMNDAMNDAVHAHPRFADALKFWLKLGLMLLPGPEATRLATYVGWLLHRTPGGLIVAAGLGLAYRML